MIKIKKKSTKGKIESLRRYYDFRNGKKNDLREKKGEKSKFIS